MSTIWTVLRATAVVVASLAALLTGGLLGTANADTGQPAPAPNIGEQLANSAANAPQVLQNLTTALTGTQPTPPTPPPLASAAIQVPQPGPAAVPGATALAPAATSALPGTAAAVPGMTSVLPGTTAATPATGPSQLLPNAKVSLPNVPFLPVPLPQQVSLPGDLASLTPGGVPIPRSIAQPPTPISTMAPASNPLLVPLSALP
ncbi:hypothetical protein MXEN_08272 [Mycobacterium xenopi RIVM700367]|uniref:Uncharacterized protein n=1 Tax=Mycobacterium xenopi TaxID=1789 RepID=A0AAD1GYW4_MYCXE|nr:hypothetical protein [Mycobacterium xenopi]EID14837.1 hypothetical protein MXEN_08272 [Mycobacterium xenopi RIVM700367]MDA3641600.1 hypothetical protein [Mycobacterium xenopi]ORX13981.1 hypothetical protein AWC32_14600 [Mycobacterium xenopi]SPX93479.1 hypothetical ala-, pro-rich protein [Mycobacterium xenopi]BBU21687.1 hypothetical protein MYXE_14760 [Mycobacterium xenopi]